MKIAVNILALISFLLVTEAQADDHVATITQIQGEIQIYSDPSSKPKKNQSNESGKIVLFENQYFIVKNAKMGDRILNGNILRARPGSHAHVIFNNGDQIHIGPGSSYRVQWQENLEKKMKIDLMYGRLRGIISKEGPRQKAIIKTRSATMGVRGTDFFIADSGPKGETEISVLRGEVEVINDSTKKSIPLKTGMSAKVVQQAEIELRETNKEDLKGIQIASTVVGKEKPSNQKIAELEKKAVEVTLKDIKLYQPEIYQKISSDPKKLENLNDLNFKAVSLNMVNAPNAPAKRGKPNITELKDSDDQEVYQKYFKMNE
jgi:hypothetical protein